jgi:dTDP-4-amino-4,6-dideoxygalactose transaminase
MARLAAAGGSPVAPDGLRIHWPEIGDAEREALLRTLERRAWCRAGMPDEDSEVYHFEREWAEYSDAKHCVAVCNGTVALMCAFWALGVQHGDEVIVPAITFIATSDAVVLCGGVPVFVDADPATYQAAPAAIEAAITSRTKAICVVHYAGYPCDLDRIAEVAHRHNLPVVEDCAHAHGSEWRGRRVGAGVTCGSFSFQQSKSLTAGEGGAVITDDPDLAERLWAIHNCGRPHGVGRYDHRVVGGNFRMSEWQGAILRAQFTRFEAQTKQRAANGAYLAGHLRELGGLEPLKPDERITQRGYYFFVMRYEPEAFGGVPRDTFLRALSAEGIPCSAAYGVPVYRNESYTQSGVPHRVEPCPVAERACASEQVVLWSQALSNSDNIPLILAACEKIKSNVDELRALAG